MSVVTKIKKYRKSFGSILIAIGTIGSALGISMFLGGGLHGVGVPNIMRKTHSTNENPTVMTWTRVNMGFINYQDTGLLVNWLSTDGYINQGETSISYRSLHNLTKNKLIRNRWKAKINAQKNDLATSKVKGEQAVVFQLQTRAEIDIYENLLQFDSMYGLSIAGIVISPIGLMILLIGLYLWYSGIMRDKKQAKQFAENLIKTNSEGTK